MQKVQAEALSRFRKSGSVNCISSVEIVTDSAGKKSVRVDLTNGDRIMDAGDKRSVFKEMTPRKSVNIGRIVSLLDAVRQYGFAAVAMGLSPAMKALLLKACKNCGIPLRVKQKDAVKNMIKQTERKTPFNTAVRKKSPVPVYQAESVSFPVVSSRSLQVTIRQQKRENNDRLQSVLQRSQEKAKEKYFDRLRSALTGIEQAQTDGRSLTADQIKVLQTAERFGLKSGGDKKENPTPQQIRERRNLSPKNLPKDILAELKSDRKRYKAICASKNKAADLVYTTHAHDLEKGKTLNLSAEELAREAASHLPPPDRRDLQNLSASMKEIKSRTAQKKAELKSMRREKRERASALMTKVMTAGGKTANRTQTRRNAPAKQPHAVDRKSFLSNSVMQELLNRRQAER